MSSRCAPNARVIKRFFPILVAFGLLLSCAAPSGAATIFNQTFNAVSSWTGKNLSAQIVFSTAGSTLTMEVTNLGDAAEMPADVLAGVFWNISTNPTLTPTSLALTKASGSGSDSILHPAGGDVLGKEWGYKKFATPVYGTDTYGVGAAGFGLFGTGSFATPGNNVQGVNYGIVNGLGSNPNAGVLVPLVSNSLTFKWSGISGSPTISDVRVQYGSTLSEPTIPEPSATVLALIAAAAGLARRRSR